MESQPSGSELLQLRPNSLERARREVGLDQPGRMKEAVKILEAWIQKQHHFRKKDFIEGDFDDNTIIWYCRADLMMEPEDMNWNFMMDDRIIAVFGLVGGHYLETTLLGSKGSIERAKRTLDRMCTLRSLLPQFFGNFNCKKDFGNLFEIVTPNILPKFTEEHYRIFWIKIHNKHYEPSQFMDYYRYNIISGEYLKVHDYACGFRIVADFSESNVLDFITKSGIVEMRQALAIYMEGFAMRIKGIHVITPSKLVDTLVSILKQVLNPKVAGRLHIHKTVEEVFAYVPQELLPAEYGGKERPMQQILNDWLDVLSSDEHMSYIRDINSAVTDEACRQRDKFNEEYAGMPGTFRVLSVD